MTFDRALEIVRIILELRSQIRSLVPMRLLWGELQQRKSVDYSGPAPILQPNNADIIRIIEFVKRVLVYCDILRQAFLSNSLGIINIQCVIKKELFNCLNDFMNLLLFAMTVDIGLSIGKKIKLVFWAINSNFQGCIGCENELGVH